MNKQEKKAAEKAWKKRGDPNRHMASYIRRIVKRRFIEGYDYALRDLKEQKKNQKKNRKRRAFNALLKTLEPPPKYLNCRCVRSAIPSFVRTASQKKRYV